MKRSVILFWILCILTSLCLTACGGTPTPPAGGGGGSGGSGSVACEHADADDSGECDFCGISVIVVVDLFAINDLHGKFCDSSTQAGVDELTTYLKSAYETEDHVLLLSSGDMWQGSSESNLTRGNIITEWMNELDFVSMTLGNHEYDWGESYIEQNADLAEFPFLGINIYDKQTNQRVSYCEPSVLLDYGEAKIGVIGAIGDCYSSISGDFSKDIYFKTGSQLTALVKAEAERLRGEGADFIVYSIHDGYERSVSGGGSISNGELNGYYDPILSGGYVDVVFEGHTHMSYTLVDGKGVYHLQNGGDNRGISYAEAHINFAGGKSEVKDAQFVPSGRYASLQDDPIVEDLMDKYEDQVSEADRVLGMNDSPRDGNYLRQLVSALYAEKGEELFGEDYDIVLGGGFLSVRSPGYLAAGQVRFAALQGLFPFENELVLCSVRGEDLMSNFIYSTNSNYFITFTEYGNSVKNSIDPSGRYYIVTDTYSSTYKPNRLTEIQRFGSGMYAQNLLADYIEAGGLTSAPPAQGGGTQGGAQISITPIGDVLAAAAALAPNQLTQSAYYIQGVVQTVVNATWGNIVVRGADGNTLYIYGTYDKDGETRFDGMSDAPAVGDTVILCGFIKRFVKAEDGVDMIEMVDARLIEQING